MVLDIRGLGVLYGSLGKRVLDLPGFLRSPPTPGWCGQAVLPSGGASEGWVISSGLHSQLDTPPLAAAQSLSLFPNQAFCNPPLPSTSLLALRTCKASLSRVCHDESIGSPKGDFNISYYLLLPPYTAPALYRSWLWDKTFTFLSPRGSWNIAMVMSQPCFPIFYGCC